MNDACGHEIDSLLKDVAEQENFKTYQIEKTSGSKKGDGYVGIMTAVKINGEVKDDQSKVLDVIVKSATTSDALRSQMPVVEAFSKEIYMYDTVFPMLQAFEAKKGLPPIKFSPKFYKARMVEKGEALVLENLKEVGFELHPRRLPMNDEHVSLVMEQYGRLHALSFALRDQNPEEFEEATTALTKNVFAEFLKVDFCDTIVHRCTKVLESLDPEIDKREINAFGEFIKTIKVFLDRIIDFSDGHSVVLHGDCWTNNMMFKYGDSNNTTKPTEVRFIDFQVSCKGSPVLDLAYFFYSSSSKDMLEKLDYYLQLYYNSLSEYLHKLGSDPSKVYPYSILQKYWKEYAKFGLIVAPIAIYAMLTEEYETIDMRDIAESGEGVSNTFNYSIASINEYNSRIRDIILHLVTNHYL